MASGKDGVFEKTSVGWQSSCPGCHGVAMLIPVSLGREVGGGESVSCEACLPRLCCKSTIVGLTIVVEG